MGIDSQEDDVLQTLRDNLLKDSNGRCNFRKERKKFLDTMATMKALPQALSGKTLREPYSSLAFIILLGQRPSSTLSILEILSVANDSPLSGKEIAKRFAEKLGISQDDPRKLASLTVGNFYEERVGIILSMLSELSLIEKVGEQDLNEGGYRVSDKEKVRFWLSFSKGKLVFPSETKPSIYELDLVKTFRQRFDERLGTIIRAKDEEKFSVVKLMESLYSIKLDFYEALKILTEIETQLLAHPKDKITPTKFYNLIYESIYKHNNEAAERFLKAFPIPISIKIQGDEKLLTSDLIRTLLLQLTKGKNPPHSCMDEMIDDITRYARKNQDKLDERKLNRIIRAQVTSRFMVPTDSNALIHRSLYESRELLRRAKEMIDSNAWLSSSRILEKVAELQLEAFLFTIHSLPFKSSKENAEYIGRILKEETRRLEIFKILDIEQQQLRAFNSLSKIPYESKNHGELYTMLKDLETVQSILDKRPSLKLDLTNIESYSAKEIPQT